jgi:PelA/Pel-15E family pectate lyase
MQARSVNQHHFARSGIACTLALLLVGSGHLLAQPAAPPATRPAGRLFRPTVAIVANWSDQRLQSEQGQQFIQNILSWQNDNGGWWKGYDLTTPRPTTLPTTIPADRAGTAAGPSTIDNSATYSEMRILARAYRLDPKPQYRAAFDRGLKLLLDMQYPNGGWPQNWPLPENYSRRITFNDNAMPNVMRMLMEIAQGKEEFAFVDVPTRQRCKEAFDRGLECTLACQIKIGGELAAWCAQHDEVSLAPAYARTYELPSLSGMESAGIVMLLMDIPNPSERVKQSVTAAYQWFDKSKISGKRMRNVRDETVPGGRDRRIVDDPSAPPQWARFYDLETNQPFYCGRDGVKKWTLAEIDADRRNNYQWMGPWAASMMERYPRWAADNGVAMTTTPPSP